MLYAGRPLKRGAGTLPHLICPKQGRAGAACRAKWGTDCEPSMAGTVKARTSASQPCETVMNMPFTPEQFFGVFRTYNEALWPAHIVLPALAVAAIGLIALQRSWSSVGVSAILAFLWGWTGLAYHLAFFTSINPLAYVFSGVSVAGAVVLVWQGIVRRTLEFSFARHWRTVAGACLVVYALILYPAWSAYAGHRYPASPTFGLPCPTTIFTIGVLGFLVAPYPRSPFVAPVLWCMVGVQGAFLLDVPEDLGLLVAGVIGAIFMLGPARSRSIPSRRSRTEKGKHPSGATKSLPTTPDASAAPPSTSPTASPWGNP